ncbi:DUF4440 domain-containing protein [Phenylobacterium sp. LjRoot219]|uniref:DUF4440 domain-containing protein n=1 Tax=Phenylobacterium sp. LjRoot219 TaxID=3342283 RepID=UPI003ED13376
MAHAADPAPVIAAERAFAADGAAHGVQASFLRWSAPDAIVFAPGPVNAQALYAAQPDQPGAVLSWRPTYAGLASSGDLGFTTGPYAINGKPRGHYFTVWARQSDGDWKWVYDGGVDNDASAAPPAEAPVAALPGMKVAAQRPAAAMAAVGAARGRPGGERGAGRCSRLSSGPRRRRAGAGLRRRASRHAAGRGGRGCDARAADPLPPARRRRVGRGRLGLDLWRGGLGRRPRPLCAHLATARRLAAGVRPAAAGVIPELVTPLG